MQREYTYVKDGTNEEVTVKACDTFEAHQKASEITGYPVYQLSWKRPHTPYSSPALTISYEEAAQLSGLYSGIDL